MEYIRYILPSINYTTGYNGWGFDVDDVIDNTNLPIYLCNIIIDYTEQMNDIIIREIQTTETKKEILLLELKRYNFYIKEHKFTKKEWKKRFLYLNHWFSIYHNRIYFSKKTKNYEWEQLSDTDSEYWSEES